MSIFAAIKRRKAAILKIYLGRLKEVNAEREIVTTFATLNQVKITSAWQAKAFELVTGLKKQRFIVFCIALLSC